MDPTGGCTLEQQTVIRDEDGLVDGVRFRFNGVWFSALDIIRLKDGLDFTECPECHGTELLYLCGTCKGVGVLEHGNPVVPPLLKPV